MSSQSIQKKIEELTIEMGRAAAAEDFYFIEKLVILSNQFIIIFAETPSLE